MFYQFGVYPKHRECPRFLWWRNTDLLTTPCIFKMNVHLFDATSSPACAKFGLKAIAADGCGRFSGEACDFLDQSSPSDQRNPSQWQYVCTDQNPAEHASQIQTSTWFTGPSFLWDSQLLLGNDMDTTQKGDGHEAVKSLAIIQRYIAKKKGKENISLIQVMKTAENSIICMHQSTSFHEEIKAINQNKGLTIRPLNHNRILRVGGRLQRSLANYDMKHLIIIPRNGHLVNSIIKHFHEKVAHQGCSFILHEIWSKGYWIVGGTRAVSSHLYKCVTCRKLRGKLHTQKMDDLPKEQTESSQNSNNLLLTLCFLAIRDPVQTIRCEEGSNFIEASHELQKAASKTEMSKIKDFLVASQAEFFTNPPSSNHMEGVWERQIYTVRSVLMTLLRQHSSRLDPATLTTFFYKVMAIVNSWPMTLRNLNVPCEPEPLTHSHLLTMKSKFLMLPLGNFV
ncbi:uncharacterized protein LOC143251274 [Tachypleus tridentatus]|uniref:uncharacterized protein LOC143251274 n=1 Tax=Tachypleus tridentatus TaxID=6853 RepID=UPI003FCF03F2